MSWHSLLFKQRSLLLGLNNFSAVGNLQTFQFISTFFVVYLHVCMVIQLAVSMIFIGRVVLAGKRKNNSPLPPKEGLILRFSLDRCNAQCDATKKRSLISPIYTTEKKKWVRTHRKVGTDQIFLLHKLSVPRFHETDPDSIFSGFLAIGRTMPPKPKKKKRVRTPFAVRKRCFKASSFRTMFFMWACRALPWFRACVPLPF